MTGELQPTEPMFKPQQKEFIKIKKYEIPIVDGKNQVNKTPEIIKCHDGDTAIINDIIEQDIMNMLDKMCNKN